MWKIKRTLLLDAMGAAQNCMPKEFLCFFGGDRKTQAVTEVVFLPTQTSEVSASVDQRSIPFDESIVGTLHSHPFGSASPSRADKKFFRGYPINAILGHPFSMENTAFFSEKGEKIAVTLE